MSNVQANTNYYLINLKGGTCMQISFEDNASVVGFGYHNGPNQVWAFESLESEKTFQIKSTGSGKYLSVSGNVRTEARIVTSDQPFPWHILDDGGVHDGVRISPANYRNLYIDLGDWGSSAPGTFMDLRPRHGRNNIRNQVWKLHPTEDKEPTGQWKILEENSKAMLECNKRIAESITEMTKILQKLAERKTESSTKKKCRADV